MRFKVLALLCLFLLLGSAISHATLSTITSPSGTICVGDSWFSIPAIPYDPAPESLFGAIPIDGALCGWDNGTAGLLTYDSWTPEDFGNIVPGDYYRYPSSAQARTISFEGFSFPAYTDAWIPLGTSSTSALIGNPQSIPLPWDVVCVTNGQVIYSLEDTASDNLMYAYGYTRDNSYQTSVVAGALRTSPNDEMFRPWYGYQVLPKVADLALIVPFEEATPCVDTNNSIADVKLSDDNDLVTITSGVVTCLGSDFFYIEQPNRISGIRVAENPSSIPVTLGDRLTFTGAVFTDSDGERYLTISGITDQQPGAAPGPLGMSNKFVGGKDWNYDSQTGAGQQGVEGGWALNNIGLLVTVWGKVERIDDYTFTVDDGTGEPIRCVAPYHYDDDYLTVTGVVSCYMDGNDRKPEILVSGPSDIDLLHRTPYTAQVSVDATETTSTVPTTTWLFGNNMGWGNEKWLFRDPTHPEYGLRTDEGDVISKVQALNIPFMRWNTGDWYHWRRGVGPFSSRPLQQTGSGPWETIFGTDEFVEFCHDINCNDMMFTVNLLQLDDLGHDTVSEAAQEAANWVEYCNGSVTGSVTRTCLVDGVEETHTVLEWAAHENWEPSNFIDPTTQADSTAYTAIEWAGIRTDGGTTYRSWRSWDDAPDGYFAWLRYDFADQRGESDPGPYNIKYWTIGNDVYWLYKGSHIYDLTNLDGTNYGSVLPEFSTAMKAVDSSVKIGAFGEGFDIYFPDWDVDVLSAADSAGTNVLDYITFFSYGTIRSLFYNAIQGSGERYRQFDFPSTGNYTFELTARTRLASCSTDPAEVELWLDAGTQNQVQLSSFTVGSEPDTFSYTTTSAIPAGVHKVSLILSNPSSCGGSTERAVFYHNLTVSSPTMSKAYVWYPEYAEQEVMFSDHNYISERIAGLRQRIHDNAEDPNLPIIITEGSMGNGKDGTEEYGWVVPEPCHTMRMKSALWLSQHMNGLIEDSAATSTAPLQAFCFWALDGSGGWDMIRTYYLDNGAHMSANLVNPEYWAMTMYAQNLPGADVLDTTVTSSTYPAWPTGLTAPVDGSARPWKISGQWVAYYPETVKYLDVLSFRSADDSKLCLMVSNRCKQPATTTFSFTGVSVGSTGTAETLSVKELAFRTPRLLWNPDMEMEASNETWVNWQGEDPWTPDDVRIGDPTTVTVGSPFVYTFEPYSITLIEIPITQ